MSIVALTNAGVASLLRGTGQCELTVLDIVCGIGLTMSLFIAQR